MMAVANGPCMVYVTARKKHTLQHSTAQQGTAWQVQLYLLWIDSLRKCTTRYQEKPAV